MKKLITSIFIFSVVVFQAQNIKKKTTSASPKKNLETSKETLNLKSTSSKPVNNAVTQSYVSKMATTIETGSYLTSMNGKNTYNLFARLALTFDLSKTIYVGPYCMSNIYTTDDPLTISTNNNNYLLKTTRLVNTGLVFGFNFFSGKKVQLVPELRVGWNFLNMQGLNFDTNKKDFLDQQYVGINPVLNLGFKICDYTVFGINGGYTLPLYIKGQKIDGYDVQTISMGAFVKFRLSK